MRVRSDKNKDAAMKLEEYRGSNNFDKGRSLLAVKIITKCESERKRQKKRGRQCLDFVSTRMKMSVSVPENFQKMRL